MVGSDNRACGTNGVPDDDIPDPTAIGSGVTKVFCEVCNPIAARSRSGPVSAKINGGDRPASPSESLGHLPGRGRGRTEPVHNECPSRAIRCSPMKPGESKSDHALSLKARVFRGIRACGECLHYAGIIPIVGGMVVNITIRDVPRRSEMSLRRAPKVAGSPPKSISKPRSWISRRNVTRRKYWRA